MFDGCESQRVEPFSRFNLDHSNVQTGSGHDGGVGQQLLRCSRPIESQVIGTGAREVDPTYPLYISTLSTHDS